MTLLVNDPADFTEELTAGFARAYAPWVRRVPGGVARRTADPNGRVALVIGGGSGHYPAFAGIVGPGLAHGAAMGNVFASPSAQQAHAVARAAEQGHGVLFGYGNYAGDVLNFDQAQARLRAEGVPCETVLVTDDISSAPRTERHLRRGVAGGLVVFKVAGAACAEGRPLDEVARLARHANDRTRTLGVAFSGCHLPGAEAPLFTVPAGRMAVGMGIHGEPGIDETGVPSARGLARLLVDALLDELPDDVPTATGGRVALVLNGLGTVKHEELFVLYGAVADQLDKAGVTVVAPEVGEFVTSLDMAGLSLTLCWLDTELEQAWQAPADTPAFRKVSRGPLLTENEVKGSPPNITGGGVAGGGATSGGATSGGATDEGDRELARTVRDAFAAAARCVDEHVDELGRLDAVAGDGDHGIGMRRGVHAALAAAERVVAAGGGARSALRQAADAWADRAGGTSGALWGLGLRAFGERLGDRHPDARVLADAIAAATAAVIAAGRATVGDKTMVDVLVPFTEAFTAASQPGHNFADVAASGPQREHNIPEVAASGPPRGHNIPEVAASMGPGDDNPAVSEGGGVAGAMGAAVGVAEDAAAATAGLVPRIGRARPHGAKSLGTPDAGAVSLALVLRAVFDRLTEPEAK